MQLSLELLELAVSRTVHNSEVEDNEIDENDGENAKNFHYFSACLTS